MNFGKLSPKFCAEFKAALALHGQKPTNDVDQQAVTQGTKPDETQLGQSWPTNSGNQA